MLKVSQYQELHQEDSDGGVFLKMIHYVAIVFNLDPLEIEGWEDIVLIEKFKKAKELLEFDNTYKNTIQIDGVELELLDFSKLKLGQFIDLETYINNDHIVNLHKIIATLYLQQEKKGMFEDTIEPIENVNIKYRSTLIQDLEIKDVIGAVDKYLKFRDNFFKSYSHIFHDPIADVDEENMTDEELEELEKEKEKQEDAKETQWLNLLNILSNQDITKFNKILDTNVFLVFNQLAFVTKK